MKEQYLLTGSWGNMSRTLTLVTLISVSSKVITCLTLCEGVVSYMYLLTGSWGNMSRTLTLVTLMSVSSKVITCLTLCEGVVSYMYQLTGSWGNMSRTLTLVTLMSVSSKVITCLILCEGAVPADRFLGKYVQNLDSSNLNVSIFKGNYMSNTMWRSSTCWQVPGEICPEPWL